MWKKWRKLYGMDVERRLLFHPSGIALLMEETTLPFLVFGLVFFSILSSIILAGQLLNGITTQ